MHPLVPFHFLRDVVRAGLQAAYDESLSFSGDSDRWSLQGFGMLRYYITEDKSLRLHVWDSRYTADPKPSVIHTHPWDMESLVVSGSIRNIRYLEVNGHHAASFRKQTIQCGVGGGLCGAPEPTRLAVGSEERIPAGESYSQRADEIYESRPDDGTVTLVRRTFGSDTEHAYVYFEGEWVTAEPRPANAAEVTDILGLALEQWR